MQHIDRGLSGGARSGTARGSVSEVILDGGIPRDEGDGQFEGLAGLLYVVGAFGAVQEEHAVEPRGEGVDVILVGGEVGKQGLARPARFQHGVIA